MENETDAQLTFSFLLLKITYVDVIYSLIAREKKMLPQVDQNRHLPEVLEIYQKVEKYKKGMNAHFAEVTELRN